MAILNIKAIKLSWLPFFIKGKSMYWGYIIYSESRDRYYVWSSGVGVEIRSNRSKRVRVQILPWVKKENS